MQSQKKKHAVNFDESLKKSWNSDYFWRISRKVNIGNIRIGNIEILVCSTLKLILWCTVYCIDNKFKIISNILCLSLSYLLFAKRTLQNLTNIGFTNYCPFIVNAPQT